MEKENKVVFYLSDEDYNIDKFVWIMRGLEYSIHINGERTGKTVLIAIDTEKKIFQVFNEITLKDSRDLLELGNEGYKLTYKKMEWTNALVEDLKYKDLFKYRVVVELNDLNNENYMLKTEINTLKKTMQEYNNRINQLKNDIKLLKEETRE